MKTQYFETSAAWENWLEKNHQIEDEIWLVYYKKHTGKTSVSYEDSVRMALCYGWIDSLIKNWMKIRLHANSVRERKTVFGRNPIKRGLQNY